MDSPLATGSTPHVSDEVPTHPSPPAAEGPRREAKFVVPDERAAQIERWARERLPLDAHAGADGTYLVTSLYFDTPAFDSFRRGGGAAWPKHRLRSYGGDSSALFLEEKVRRGDAVWKRRVPCVPADWAHGLPLAASPALAWFGGRFRRLGLQPVLHVRYRRLAFVLPHGERLTIDSEIVGRPAATDPTIVASPADGYRPVYDRQIVELKYTGQPSPAMALALQELHDDPVRNSKYSLGIRALELSPEPGAGS